MDKKTSNLLFSFLYLLAFYLAIKFIPFEKMTSFSWFPVMMQSLCLVLLLAMILYEVKKNGLVHRKKENHLNYLLLIPLILGCASNLLYCLFFQVAPSVSFDPVLFPLNSFKTLLSVSIEELLFRFFFLEFLICFIKDGKWKNVLVVLFSSLAFSLMHVVNFFGNAPLSVLIQIGYTFLLGGILSYLALMFESPIVPILGHFLFNYLNTDIFVCLYSVEINLSYVLFSIGIGLILLIYLFVLYDLDRRKNIHGAN
jgi:membrane protease YdiL (CAAX protease family)